jgi:YfiH family protein
MIIYQEETKLFISTLVNDNRFICGFGTKEIGDGRKVQNIIHFFEVNKLPLTKIVIPEQIHSTNIIFFQSSNQQLIETVSETDGVITNQKNTALTVITADCQPIVYLDKENGIIAISHQGWRGSVKRLPQKIVKEMVRLGANLDKIIVALGPVIGECCYTIDDDRYYQFLEEFDGYSDQIFSFFACQRHLNLGRLNYLQLLEVGINKNQIDFFPFCTACDKSRFFSLRRERKKLSGEMINFVAKL